MKSRVRTYSKKEIGWLCGEAMPEIDRCINANGLVFFDSCIKAYRLETKAHGGFYKNTK